MNDIVFIDVMEVHIRWASRNGLMAKVWLEKWVPGIKGSVYFHNPDKDIANGKARASVRSLSRTLENRGFQVELVEHSTFSERDF